ncbi:MAG: restriction endonuclease subunit S [Methylotenera sp.]|nr:restriction endonuclease subunit S [Methylotenera sp.]
MLPSGWYRKAISEVLNKVSIPVDVVPNEKYREIGIRSHARGIFHKEEITGKSLGNKRVFHIEPNCFVVNIVFAWEQAVAKTTANELGMIASHRFPMFKPKSEQCDIDYILFLFKTEYGKYLLGLASPGGAGRNKTLGQSEFAKLVIKLPPLKEQIKIANIITTWDKAIETTEKLIINSQQQKKYLTQQLLTGKHRVAGFTGAWQKFTLSQLGDTYSGLSGKTKENFGIGKPYIPYINIFKNSRISIKEFEYVQIDVGERQNQVKYGDIFFTTSSETAKEVGMSAVLLDTVEELYLNSFCFGYRLKNFDLLIPEFAVHLFRGQELRKDLTVLAQGATRYNLSKTQFLKLDVRLPSIKEQREVASILTTADREIESLKTKYQLLIQEKKALMQQLLTGKRRVTV